MCSLDPPTSSPDTLRSSPDPPTNPPCACLIYPWWQPGDGLPVGAGGILPGRLPGDAGVFVSTAMAFEPNDKAFYYDKRAIMSNEEFDNLKEELMWEGSSVVMLSPDEQRLLEASMAYVAGNPIMTDAEFDELKLRLRKEGSEIVQEGPRCSLRSRKVYSDLTVDYFKMFLLNVPAAVVALTL